jgi:hypothetical protein
MRKAVFGSAIVIVLLAGVVCAVANLGGTWRAEFAGPDGGTATETLALSEKQGNVTGTFTNAVGGVGPLRDGKWDGTTLRFWVAWEGTDRLEATGRLVGDALQLDLRTPKWQARRAFKRVSAAR